MFSAEFKHDFIYLFILKFGRCELLIFHVLFFFRATKICTVFLNRPMFINKKNKTVFACLSKDIAGFMV